MRITACDRRRGMLYRLTLNEEQTVEIDLHTFDESGLKAGDCLDEEALSSLLAASRSRRARESAMWYLSQRDYARGELEQKLRRNHDADVAAEAADRMVELGLVDDARYAGMLSRDLAHFKLYSRRHIRQELLQKGIDRDAVEEAMQALDIDDTAQAKALLERKYKRTLTDENGRRKTAAALARAGFDYAAIRRAIEEVSGNADDLD